MLNEKQTDTWRNTLSGLDNLPGDAPLNKEAAWERLHGRLYKKPVGNKPAWYWAAACLLMVMALLWIANNKKEPVEISANPLKQNISGPANRPASDYKENTVASAPLHVAGNRKLKNENTTRKAVYKSDHLKKTQVSIATVIPGTIPVVIHSIVPPADTVAASIAFVRKKLAVVHINELDPAVETFPSVALHTRKKFRITVNKIKSNGTTAAATNQYAGVRIQVTN